MSRDAFSFDLRNEHGRGPSRIHQSGYGSDSERMEREIRRLRQQSLLTESLNARSEDASRLRRDLDERVITAEILSL